MSLKAIPIILTILMSTSIECHSWCQYIMSNGIYRGLGIYRLYETDRGNSTLQHSLRMFNKAGKEWRFNIDFEGDMSIKLNESSITVGTESDVPHKFVLMNEIRDRTYPVPFN